MPVDVADLAATGPGWALAAPDRRASAAGAAAFRAGGNAVDAALAAAAMLAVVYPHQCSVGGDAIALVGTPDGEVRVINGSGRAARAVDVEAVRSRHRVMPLSGPLPVTVPGVVGAWTEIATRWGRLPLRAALLGAAAAAADGVEVVPGLARQLIREQHQLGQDTGTAGVFLTGDGPLPAGSTLRQPRLAQTLTELADDPAAIYTGRVAGALVDRLRELGSALTREDFATHRTAIEPPRSAAFGPEEYLSAGASSQGVFFLAALRALDLLRERGGTAPDPHGGEAALVSQVLRRVARERDRLLADPEHVEVPQEWLLSDEHAVQLVEAATGSAGAVRPAAVGSAAGVAAAGDTVAIVAADRDGTWISLIQSVFHAFGAAVLDPVTGVLLHNRGASFSLNPSAAGQLAGGRRPPHTLMPVLVRREGRVVGAHGTMGGRAQPQIHAQLALHLSLGRPLETAPGLPRWVLDPMPDLTADPMPDLTADPMPGPTASGATSGDRAGVPSETLESVQLEADVPVAARSALLDAGYRVIEVPPRDDEVGHAQLVRLQDGRLTAASDPRADGAAVAG